MQVRSAEEWKGLPMKQALCLLLVLATGCTTWQKIDHHNADRVARADLVGKEIRITKGSERTDFVVSWITYPRLGGRDSLGRLSFDLSEVEKLQVKGSFEHLAFLQIVVIPLVLIGVLISRGRSSSG